MLLLTTFYFQMVFCPKKLFISLVIVCGNYFVIKSLFYFGKKMWKREGGGRKMRATDKVTQLQPVKEKKKSSKINLYVIYYIVHKVYFDCFSLVLLIELEWYFSLFFLLIKNILLTSSVYNYFFNIGSKRQNVSTTIKEEQLCTIVLVS